MGLLHLVGGYNGLQSIPSRRPLLRLTPLNQVACNVAMKACNAVPGCVLPGPQFAPFSRARATSEFSVVFLSVQHLVFPELTGQATSSCPHSAEVKCSRNTRRDASEFCWLAALSFAPNRIGYRSLYAQCLLNNCALSYFVLAVAQHLDHKCRDMRFVMVSTR